MKSMWSYIHEFWTSIFSFFYFMDVPFLLSNIHSSQFSLLLLVCAVVVAIVLPLSSSPSLHSSLCSFSVPMWHWIFFHCEQCIYSIYFTRTRLFFSWMSISIIWQRQVLFIYLLLLLLISLSSSPFFLSLSCVRWWNTKQRSSMDYFFCSCWLRLSLLFVFSLLFSLSFFLFNSMMIITQTFHSISNDEK